MNVIKQVVKMALSQTFLAGGDKRYIFLYHDISDPGSAQYSPLHSTPVPRFHEQIEFLTKHFRIVSVEEIVLGNLDRKIHVDSVTFDEGFFYVTAHALRYLTSKRIPFAVFVNKMAIKHNRLSNSPEESPVEKNLPNKVFLDENDIKYLFEKGVIIGSHSSTHKVLAQCDDGELRKEVLDNKLYIEGVLGKPVKHMALPFGKREHYNEHVLEYCYS